MINHVRTLLLNRTREGTPRDYPGEEFIETNFVPKDLSTSLRLVQQVLFGADPDRLFLNYRMRQLMALIHSTELGQFAEDKDPRITYLPFTGTSFFDEVFKTTVAPVGTTGNTVHLLRSSVADDTIGRSYRLWKVELTPATVTVTRRSPPVTEEVHILQGETLSQEIQLPGDELRIRLSLDGTNIGEWDIEAWARPLWDAIDTLRHLEVAVDGVDQFFGPLPPEPIATYLRLWLSDKSDAYRYGALLLAIAEQVDKRPQGM